MLFLATSSNPNNLNLDDMDLDDLDLDDINFNDIDRKNKNNKEHIGQKLFDIVQNIVFFKYSLLNIFSFFKTSNLEDLIFYDDEFIENLNIINIPIFKRFYDANKHEIPIIDGEGSLHSKYQFKNWEKIKLENLQNFEQYDVSPFNKNRCLTKNWQAEFNSILDKYYDDYIILLDCIINYV